MGRILLDPNAQAYADLNDLDSVAATKLAGIDENAEVNPTDAEVITAINNAAEPITREDALSQADLKIVKSEPQSGERAVTSISVDASDKLAADHSDTPEP